MLINSNINVGVRCENCGVVEVHGITFFQINNKELRLHCTCGSEKLLIVNKNKTVQISIPCDICGINHVYRYGIRELLNGKNKKEVCPSKGNDSLWIGEKEWIENEIIQMESAMPLSDIKKNIFFNNPQIMMDILEWLYSLKDRDYLNCECGSESKDIGINLFSDRVELYCKKCTGLSVIYAETEEDLKNLLKTDKILIHEKTFACIDAINFNGDK